MLRIRYFWKHRWKVYFNGIIKKNLISRKTPPSANLRKSSKTSFENTAFQTLKTGQIMIMRRRENESSSTWANQKQTMARDFCHGYILYFAPIFSKGWFRSWNRIKRYFLCEYFSPSRIKTPKFIENQSSQKPKFNFVDAYNNITILLGPYFPPEKIFMQLSFIKDYWMKTKYIPVSYINHMILPE